ncbi:hypothetical protein JYU01_02225 [bacterium AH-315-L21]|nr:hypothetical protein [bacterium AH-315-L21]
MSKIRKIVGLLLVASFFVASFGGAFAQGERSVLSSEERKTVITSLIELGITDKSVQSNLIAKLERGEIWDSMNKEKTSELERHIMAPSLHDPVKRHIFEDGSVLLVKISNEIENKSSYSILSEELLAKIQSSGTGYMIVEDLRVSIKTGLVGMGFTVDFVYVNGGYDYIFGARKPYCNVVLGSYSDLEVSIVRRSETSRLPAEAVASANITSFGGVKSGTSFCVFRLRDNNYNVSSY